METDKNEVDNLPSSIATIFEILDNNGVFFWLDAGSLLKGARDGSILFSSDIDVSATVSEIPKIIQSLEELSSLGYEIKFNGGLPFFEDQVTILLPNKINRLRHVDIYIFREYGEAFVRRNIHKPDLNSKGHYLFFLAKKLFELSNDFDRIGSNNFIYTLASLIFRSFGKVFFSLYEGFGFSLWYIIPGQYFRHFKPLWVHDRCFYAPSPVEEYLEFRYGPDWKYAKARSDWFNSWIEGADHIIQVKRLKSVKSHEKSWIKHW